MQAAPASLLPACHQRWVQASTSSLLTSIGLKNEIARDDHANRKPRSDSQRGRNVELSAHDLLARIVERVLPARSDDRRVGKECVSTCSYRWSTYHQQKTQQ